MSVPLGMQRSLALVQELSEMKNLISPAIADRCLWKGRTGASEGSCKVLYERFGGQRGSWWIQQRGALRRPPRAAGQLSARVHGAGLLSPAGRDRLGHPQDGRAQ